MKKYAETLDDITPVFPGGNYVPQDIRDGSETGFSHTETLAVVESPYIYELDYQAARFPVPVVTVNGNPRTIIPYTDDVDPGSGQVAISFTSPIIRYADADEGAENIVVSYLALGSVATARFLNQLQAEVAAVQEHGSGGDIAIGDVEGLQDALNGKSNTVHNHDDRYYTTGEMDTSLGGITSALAGKANVTHTHAISDVTGLDAALGSKAEFDHAHDANEIGSGTVDNTEFGYLNGVTSAIQAQLNGKAASSHTHSIANVTGLQSALDGKAASSHGHTISDITSLQSTLDSKAGLSGNQTFANQVTAASFYTTGNITFTGTLNGTIDAANITTGILPMARLSGTLPALNGSNLTSLQASAIANGTLGVARGGTGITLTGLTGNAGKVMAVNSTATGYEFISANTFVGSSGLIVKYNSGSPGFQIYDRPEAPARQVNFASLYPANTNGSQAIINVFQKGTSRANTYNCVYSGFSLWATDPSVETAIQQNATLGVQQDYTGSNTGRLSFFTYNYGSNGSSINPMPIEFNAGNATGNWQIKTAYESSVNKVGFFGVTPVAKPTITGSTTDDKVSSIITALQNLGLAS